MKQKILNVLSVLFGLLLLNGGLNKFFNYMPAPDDISEAMLNDFGALKEIVWLMPLLGLAEIGGGILIAIPKTRALGAVVIFPVAVGILLTHIFVDTNGLIIALVTWSILIWILVENKGKYAHLIE